MLKERGEVIVEFRVPAGTNANYFSSVISVDNVIGDTITAYANTNQFNRFLLMEIPFVVLEPPSLTFRKAYKEEKEAVRLPAGYPSYYQYVEMMEGFAEDYPEICRLVEYGQSVEGRKLLALKITDNPGTHENEPAFMYSSSIHGDEVVGYVLMLYLIEELLTGYGTDPGINNLVDNIEIWINPLANPDGTYFVSDESVYGATRNNANQIDLNRNFPDPGSGDHPDGNGWQAETVAMMDLMKDVHLVLAANFHGGVEVVNYPWDTWSRLHADDTWYREISRAYADTVHVYSPPDYMIFRESGITNGFAWYSISGGRQDYCNYFIHGREVTIELSDEKMPAEVDLPAYWEYNRRSILDYINLVLYGVSGVVTDAITGNPVRAIIEMAGSDRDSSQIFSSAEDGTYYRLLPPGNVTLTFKSPGYQEAVISAVVPYRDMTTMNARLHPLIPHYRFYPNPFYDLIYIYIPDTGEELQIELFDVSGHKVKSFSQSVISSGNQKIGLKDLAAGVYIIRAKYDEVIITEKILKLKF